MNLITSKYRQLNSPVFALATIGNGQKLNGGMPNQHGRKAI